MLLNLLALLQESASATGKGYALIGAGLAAGRAVLGAGIGIGRSGGQAVGGQAVREREQRLERQLAEAGQGREEAASLLEQQKQALERARAVAQEIVTKAKAVAEKERATLLAKAREEYELLLARAKKDI